MRTSFPIDDIRQIDCRNKSSFLPFLNSEKDFLIRTFIYEKNHLFISKSVRRTPLIARNRSEKEYERIWQQYIKETLISVISEDVRDEVFNRITNASSYSDNINTYAKEVEIVLDKFYIIPHSDITKIEVKSGFPFHRRAKLHLKNSELKEITFSFVSLTLRGPIIFPPEESANFAKYMRKQLKG